jgi:metal-responsive CopG/Arc/MetJ family transcriptional regulator
MSVTVSIKVRRELAELADKMVKYGIARSRSHAFNIMIEKGLAEVLKEVEFWEGVYRRVEELERQGSRLRRGGLSELLSKERGR